jgi:hypothetical protein
MHYQPLAPFSDHRGIQLRESIQACAATSTGFPTPFTTDEVIFVIDTGASVTVTNSKSDFVSELHPVQPTKLQGIAAGLEVKGIGDAEYVFRMDNNTTISILFRNVLYVPNCTVRLLCPRHLAESTNQKTDGFNSLHDVGILTCHGQSISVPYHSSTGLPIISTAAGLTSYTEYCAAFTVPSTKQPFDSSSFPASPAISKQNLSNQQRVSCYCMNDVIIIARKPSII